MIASGAYLAQVDILKMFTKKELENFAIGWISAAEQGYVPRPQNRLSAGAAWMAWIFLKKCWIRRVLREYMTICIAKKS